MKKRKKLPLSLLEITIAMSLVALLFSALFYGYQVMARKRINMQQKKQHLLLKNMMFTRLSQIFAKISAQNESDEKNGEWIFVTIPSPAAHGLALVFTYDNGIDPDPAFCGNVRAMLYLSKQNALCLVTWSSAKDPRKEVLLEQCAELRFEFFDVEQKKWIPNWEKDDITLPSMVRLFVKEHSSDAKAQIFPLFIPKIEPIILYHSQEAPK